MDSASSSQSKEISSSSSHIPIDFPANLGAHYERTKNEISNAFPSLSTTLNLINLANTTPLLDERRSRPQTPNLTNLTNTTPLLGERRSQPNQRGHSLYGQLNCPRCESTNTKFCYYNNYSLTQPRYFCKACRRYWTEGGSLCNVPLGGGSRKNKKPSSSSSSFSHPSSSSNTTNKLPSESNLGFNTFLSLESSSIVTDTSTSTTSSGTNPCGVMSIPEFGTGFGLPYLRRALLGLSLDGSGTVADGVGATGVGGVFGSMDQVQDSGRIKFLFGDLKPMGASTGEADQFEQNKQMVEERGKK